MIDETYINEYLNSTFEDMEETDSFGYKLYFYKDDHMLPFVTTVSADNEHDQVSNLDRLGVFRLNVGVSRETFKSLFGSNKVDVNNYDFTALNTIMPHPDYSSQSFICVLSPTRTTFETLKPLLTEAYEIAQRRYIRRNPSDTT